MAASKVIRMPTCRVCGRVVSSADVAFGVGTKALFYAHEGECAEVISGTTEMIGKLTRIVLETKHPGLLKSITRGVDKLQRLVRVLSE